jgi:hypothetical protein
MSVRRFAACTAAVSLMAFAGSALAAGAGDPWPPVMSQPWPDGALSKKNLAKPRPKPPFDLTGVWLIVPEAATGGVTSFRPMPKLKPEAQALFDASVKANAEGKAFRDDTGNCWPAGMPKWLNRVWPIQMMQYPTMIVMILELNNQIRWVYLDGRGHLDPEINPATYNGDSIGRWEGNELVIDTTNFEAKRHWVESGVPVSDKLHTVERIRMAPDGKSIDLTVTMTDPVNWEGEWINHKHYVRQEDRDITEVQCLPDLNEHLSATWAEHNVR